MKTRKLGILLFPEVEVLDVAGPFEVFNLAGMGQSPKPFEVFTIAQEKINPARGGLTFQAKHLLTDPMDLDMLLVPGGPGSRREIHNERLLDFIRAQASRVECLLSVCTGALLLAQAGVVPGMSLTTHHLAVAELQALAPDHVILPEQRILDHGRVILSAGISSGIDMSLYVVKKLWGETTARQTAEHMEYPWPVGLPA